MRPRCSWAPQEPWTQWRGHRICSVRGGPGQGTGSGGRQQALYRQTPRCLGERTSQGRSPGYPMFPFAFLGSSPYLAIGSEVPQVHIVNEGYMVRRVPVQAVPGGPGCAGDHDMTLAMAGRVTSAGRKELCLSGGLSAPPPAHPRHRNGDGGRKAACDLVYGETSRDEIILNIHHHQGTVGAHHLTHNTEAYLKPHNLINIFSNVKVL